MQNENQQKIIASYIQEIPNLEKGLKELDIQILEEEKKINEFTIKISILDNLPKDISDITTHIENQNMVMIDLTDRLSKFYDACKYDHDKENQLMKNRPEKFLIYDN